jgi:magnesium-transporting ATPase (P-type)
LSGELIWRVTFISVMFVIGTFGMFYWAEQRGLPIETGRTMVVNTLVVFEVFYLFSVRYVHGTSLTLRGVVGTPAVLIGVTVVFVAQLAFTYLPFLQRVFATRPLELTDGAVIVAAGVVLLFASEFEKRVRARLLGSKTRARAPR